MKTPSHPALCFLTASRTRPAEVSDALTGYSGSPFFWPSNSMNRPPVNLLVEQELDHLVHLQAGVAGRDVLPVVAFLLEVLEVDGVEAVLEDLHGAQRVFAGADEVAGVAAQADLLVVVLDRLRRSCRSCPSGAPGPWSWMAAVMSYSSVSLSRLSNASGSGSQDRFFSPSVLASSKVLRLASLSLENPIDAVGEGRHAGGLELLQGLGRADAGQVGAEELDVVELEVVLHRLQHLVEGAVAERVALDAHLQPAVRVPGMARVRRACVALRGAHEAGQAGPGQGGGRENGAGLQERPPGTADIGGGLGRAEGVEEIAGHPVSSVGVRGSKRPLHREPSPAAPTAESLTALQRASGRFATPRSSVYSSP